MTYLLKHNERGRPRYRTFLPLILVALFGVTTYYFAGSLLSSVLSQPLVAVSGFLSNSVSNIFFGSKVLLPDTKFISENEALKKRAVDIEAELLELELLRKENSLLREKLDLSPPDLISASILLAPPAMPFDTILIDRGTEDGLTVGVKVFLWNHVALGYIEEVHNRTAKIKMYSSSGMRTSAIYEKDGTIVELEGRGGENFILEAPLGFPIEEGDLFLLPGFRVAVLAVADKVKRDEGSSFTTVLLRLPLKLHGHSPLFIERE